MWRALGPAGIALGLLACANTGRSAPARLQKAPSGTARDVATGDLCVTCGTLHPQADGRFLVDSPKMRAVVDQTTGNVVELQFTYLGPTRMLMALSSGAPRTQVGIKLFAHDACNLVYVMWRQSPTPGVVVSTKRNLGMQQSDDCGNRGYTNVRPRQQVPAPPIVVGVPHRLRVQRAGAVLSVYADAVLAWQGEIPAALPDDLAGLTGVRSDNGRYIMKLLLSQEASGPAWLGPKPKCTSNRPSVTSPGTLPSLEE